MAGYQGHDTGDTVTSAELIASPQYVNDAAYTALQGVFFPDPLPFTRPLTLLRLQMNALGVALPDAMAALRASDSLDRHRQPRQLRLDRHPHRAGRHLPRRVPDLHRPVPAAR